MPSCKSQSSLHWKRICTATKSYPELSLVLAAEISNFEYFIAEFPINAFSSKIPAWDVGGHASCYETEEQIQVCCRQESTGMDYTFCSSGQTKGIWKHLAFYSLLLKKNCSSSSCFLDNLPLGGLSSGFLSSKGPLWVKQAVFDHGRLCFIHSWLSLFFFALYQCIVLKRCEMGDAYLWFFMHHTLEVKVSSKPASSEVAFI